MDYGDIKDLIGTIVGTDIMLFELNYNGVDIKIDRNKTTERLATVQNVSETVEVVKNVTPKKDVVNKDVPKLDMNRIAIDTAAKPTKEGDVATSPIVGTFYSAASPTSEPFVKVGSKVKKGDVLFIIEAMKVINEIPSEFEGEVLEVLAKDGELVEYGQPLVVIG